MNNLTSFVLGVGLCWFIYFVATFLDDRRDKKKGFIEMDLSLIREAMAGTYSAATACREALLQIRDKLESPIPPPEPEWLKPALIQIAEIYEQPVRVAIDYDRIEKALVPLKEALFRIAADTELSKHKFDVLARAIGVDERTDYLKQYAEDPDDNDKMFEAACVVEMKQQGLSWPQAVNAVKERLAHRNRVR